MNAGEGSQRILLQTATERREAEVRSGDAFESGDIVEIDPQGKLRLLTPNRAKSRTHGLLDRTLDPRRLRAIGFREKVETSIREFFRAKDFREVRTPLLVPCPGMETHIRPFEISRHERPPAFLPTSPEFAMKKLLVGGLERIYQICPAFRDEPESTTHRPEFTLLEWYRAYAGYEEIMGDTEALFEFVAQRLFGKSSLRFQNREISVAPPWPRLRIRDLFLEKTGVDLVKSSDRESLAHECKRLGLRPDENDSWDDLYFRIWLNRVEPELPRDRAVFVTRYPSSQSALAVKDRDSDGSIWAKRFEVYAGGLELANAFEELTDPVEQRSRFSEDMDLRERTYGPGFPRTPIDEGFLQALEEGLPPSGGIAMGVDRMVMLFADEPDIDFTFWLN